MKIHINDIMFRIFNEKIDVLNISFREYIVLFEDYFITVYPFSYSVYSYENASIDNIKFYKCKKYDFAADKQINDHHHFHETGQNKYPPSEIFEKVSGFLIFTNNNIIEYNLRDPIICKEWDDKYDRDTKEFDSICKNKIRAKKIKRLQ